MKTIPLPSTKKFKSDPEQSEKNNSEISHWTDLQLKVEYKELYVPKSFLAMVSPVFRLMFESDFKEKDIDELPLPGKKYEDVLIFLKCTHPGKRLKVTYDIVPKVLPLAHEYQVQWLIDDCSSLMIMQMTGSPSLFPISTLCTKYCNICIMAEKYDLTSVVARCMEVISSINYLFYKDLT
ncbi:hypothetical protein ACJMK2_028238 [Sinanodonta woodiana]|uniref:BTB domain-containing protein n=1 Tax=Sinanodonta woodiana TaxID=1069815 RepID=A0ABD3X8D6_SINWO